MSLGDKYLTTAAEKKIQSVNTVAAIQMVSSSDIQENLDHLSVLISGSVLRGARLVVIPEMFACMGSNKAVNSSLQSSDNSSILAFISDLARDHQVWIVSGSIPYREQSSFSQGDTITPKLHTDRKLIQSKPFSRCVVFNSKGDRVAEYDKIHLFDAIVDDGQRYYRESDSFSAGNRVVVIDTPFGRLGLAICYDLRFPELFRLMFQAGVDIIAIPSAFTKLTGRAHWRTLIKARAIENSCYVIAANQGGEHSDKRETYGHSMIVNPWGEILDEIKTGEGVVVADVDLAYCETTRNRIPCHLHQVIKIPER